jgi:hypothetical protein
MTNADKIRQMTDEEMEIELANYICDRIEFGCRKYTDCH